jgi:hypothetical protein
MFDIEATDLDKQMELTDLILTEIFCNGRVPSSCTNLHAHRFAELVQFTRQIRATIGSTFEQLLSLTERSNHSEGYY